jgi:serine protease Do
MPLYPYHQEFDMRVDAIVSNVCLSTLLASAVCAQPTLPRAHVASQRVVVQRGSSYLGVGVVEIDSAERAKVLHLKDQQGVEVRCVDPNSPAAKAGLKEGDVMLEYNGQRLEGGEQFMRLVRETPPARSVTLLVSRNGANQTLTATIGQRQPGPMAFEFGDDTFAMAMSGPAFMEVPVPAIRIPDIPKTFMTWRSPTLGVESESLNPQLAEFFGVKEGVLVRSVTHDSAAEKAGFKAGDVIIKVGSEKVTTPREISSILQSSRSKKTLPVTVMRHQKEVVLNVTLEESSYWQPFETHEML